MLDEKKLEMCRLLLSGQTITDTAKALGISRQSIYTYKQDPEVMAAMEELQEEIKRAGSERITGQLDTYLSELHLLAVQTTDKRTKANVLMYLTDRILGKIKTTTEIISEDKERITV
ncbi:MAG TPA: helix-turn-helix domain-containing protein, partial [Clostridium sp.]